MPFKQAYVFSLTAPGDPHNLAGTFSPAGILRVGSIYLIRHGQASFGADDYDVLSPTGIRQAEILGDHLLNLTPGILDLGELLEAPALRGLRLSTRGYRILLTDVPAGLSVAPSGEHTPLKPGMYLPERIGLLLRGL